MFTGIVQSIGIVRAFQRRSGGARLVVETGLPEELLRIGDSIAVDGCCQTIVQAEGTVCTFDCLEETLRRSVFGEYVPGRLVNMGLLAVVGIRDVEEILSAAISSRDTWTACSRWWSCGSGRGTGISQSGGLHGRSSRLWRRDPSQSTESR